MKYGDRRSDGDQERLPSPWQSLLASVVLANKRQEVYWLEEDQTEEEN